MSSSKRIKFRKVEEIDTVIVREEPPPSKETGYVLIYKNDKFPKTKRFSKEEPTIGSVKLESQFKKMITMDLHTKVGLLLIYLSVIGGLIALFLLLFISVSK